MHGHDERPPSGRTFGFEMHNIGKQEKRQLWRNRAHEVLTTYMDQHGLVPFFFLSNLVVLYCFKKMCTFEIRNQHQRYNTITYYNISALKIICPVILTLSCYFTFYKKKTSELSLSLSYFVINLFPSSPLSLSVSLFLN